jgi:hypothetical protein
LEKGEIHTKFWSENLKGRDHLGNPHVDGRIKLKRIVKKEGMKVWIKFIWLIMRTSGGLLRIRWDLTFGFNKTHRISGPAICFSGKIPFYGGSKIYV